jgi:CRP-like cAMP-binding protein
MGLHSDRKIELIKAAPLFANCSKGDLKAIARIADELDLPAGRDLIREGERGREFFVLVAGEADVRRKGRRVATIGPGDIVGEMALVSGLPRNATVTSTTPLDVLVIDERHFREMLRQYPEIQTKVLRSLADRLAAVSD